MPAPFEVKTVTVRLINGRELNRAIKNLTGHDFDPVRNGRVGGGDSGGTWELRVDPAGEAVTDYSLQEFQKFQITGKGSLRGVAIGYLMGLAAEGLIPFGTYQVEYTWG